MNHNSQKNEGWDRLILDDEPRWSYCCPSCNASLISRSQGVLICPHEGFEFFEKDGIWRFVLPERLNYFDRFIHEYQAIRLAEGRESNDPTYYRSLPDQDLTKKWSTDWQIRSKSYHALEQIVLELAEVNLTPLRIIDLGSGNGWLSNRLASLGHIVCAVDLMTNDFDGLGAYHFYETKITPLQAEFDRLPLISNQANVIIFNSSLHYAPDYLRTLQEALRVLRRDGHLVIMDTPIYHDPESGRQMVVERSVYFEQRFGFRADSIPSQNYLTFDQLDWLAGELNLHWRMVRPNYGLLWRLKPWLARLRGQREPAQFILVIGGHNP